MEDLQKASVDGTKSSISGSVWEVPCWSWGNLPVVLRLSVVGLAKHVSVAFCSPAKSLTFSGLMETPLVGEKFKIQANCTKDMEPEGCWGTIHHSSQVQAEREKHIGRVSGNKTACRFAATWTRKIPNGLLPHSDGVTSLLCG